MKSLQWFGFAFLLVIFFELSRISRAHVKPVFIQDLVEFHPKKIDFGLDVEDEWYDLCSQPTKFTRWPYPILSIPGTPIRFSVFMKSFVNNPEMLMNTFHHWEDFTHGNYTHFFIGTAPNILINFFRDKNTYLLGFPEETHDGPFHLLRNFWRVIPNQVNLPGTPDLFLTLDQDTVLNWPRLLETLKWKVVGRGFYSGPLKDSFPQNSLPYFIYAGSAAPYCFPHKRGVDQIDDESHYCVKFCDGPFIVRNIELVHSFGKRVCADFHRLSYLRQHEDLHFAQLTGIDCQPIVLTPFKGHYKKGTKRYREERPYSSQEWKTGFAFHHNFKTIEKWNFAHEMANGNDRTKPNRITFGSFKG